MDGKNDELQLRTFRIKRIHSRHNTDRYDHHLRTRKPRPPWRRFRRFRRRTALLYATLHPRAGRKLAKELRAEVVGRLASNFPLGVRDPGFESLLGRIMTGPIHHGDKVELFFRGEPAFASVLEAIEGAKEEILLETYILRDDETGRRFLGYLGKAVERGVRVRVLADAIGSWSTKNAYWTDMQALGIEVRQFHPLWSHFRSFLYRDHRKIIVVDRRIAFTGGMNIANEYGSSRDTEGTTWRDTHMRVDGATAWEMAIVFQEGWKRSGGRSLHLPPLTQKVSDGAKTMVLGSLPGRGSGEMASVLAALVTAARDRLWITNSYFAPNRTAIRLLASAARRGVDVRLLLQGPTDMPLVRHAGHGNYNELLESGVRIYEYVVSVLHAKTVLVDDYVSIIGSTNLDFRSFYYNAECNVLIFDEDIAQKMAVAFEKDLQPTPEILLESWVKRPLYHRIGDKLAWYLSPLL
jgi:cardiolipin synthase